MLAVGLIRAPGRIVLVLAGVRQGPDPAFGGIARDDHYLGKVMEPARRLGSPPLSGLFSAGSSAQPAESARLRPVPR